MYFYLANYREKVSAWSQNFCHQELKFFSPCATLCTTFGIMHHGAQFHVVHRRLTNRWCIKQLCRYVCFCLRCMSVLLCRVNHCSMSQGHSGYVEFSPPLFFRGRCDTWAILMNIPMSECYFCPAVSMLVISVRL